MEETLVNDIKRLRVLTPSDHDNMDEQVPDQESQNSELPCINKVTKTFLLLKRDERSAHSSVTNYDGHYGLKSSEESESSLDDAVRCHKLGGCLHSDSDDIKSVWHQQKLNTWRTSAAPIVESDSVNENFHPIREQKRKKKFKRMAVDPHPCVESEEHASKSLTSKSDSKRPYNQRSRSTAKVSLEHHANVGNVWDPVLDSTSNFCGKRKRSVREKSTEFNGTDKRPNCCLNGANGPSEASAQWLMQGYFMDYDGIEQNTQQEASSSGLSSSESECGILTNDEGREADDEQSDCFHETSSDILLDDLLARNMNVFRKRFDCVTNYGPKVSQTKHGFLETWRRREITSGRRRLNKFKPVVCHNLKDEPLRNEFHQGETAKSGSKKRCKVPSAATNYQRGNSSIPISDSHGSPTSWKMEWKQDQKACLWSSGC